MYLFDTVYSRGLVNYYPIIDSVIRDIVGGQDPYNCKDVSLSSDRFGVANSALGLGYGFCSLPSYNYLNYPNGFTFTFWTLTQDGGESTFYFLSFYADNNHYFSIGPDGDGYSEVCAQTQDNPSNSIDFDAGYVDLVANIWQHHTVVNQVQNKKIFYYVNGLESGSDEPYDFHTPITFIENYLGKSAGNPTRLFVGKLDEIRFFEIGFSQQQAVSDMGVSSFLTKISY